MQVGDACDEAGFRLGRGKDGMGNDSDVPEECSASGARSLAVKNNLIVGCQRIRWRDSAKWTGRLDLRGSCRLRHRGAREDAV